MNKLFTKIGTAIVGIAMAIGVGVAVGRDGTKEVSAAGETWASSDINYELATSISAGDKIILVSTNAAKAMGAQGDNNRSSSNVTKSGTTVSNKKASPSADNSVGLITVQDGGIKDAVQYYNFSIDGKYLYDASTSNKNYLRTRASVGTDGYADFSVSINSSGVASISARAASNGRLVMSFNPSSSYVLACYASLMDNGGIEIYKNPDVPVNSVGLDKTSASIGVGATLSLTATVLPDNATNKNVSWSSDDEDVATVENGVVTAVSAGTANITATSVADNTKYASCEVTVTEAIPVASVSIKESTSLMIGETETLTATVLPDNATVKTVNWSSDDEDVATVENGVVTAVSVGTAHITATSTADNTKSSTCTITVTAYVPHTYTKVTSAPSDWRGTYLLVYEKTSTSGEAFDSTMETFDVTEKTISVSLNESKITGTKAIDDAAIKIERDTIEEKSRYFALCGNGDYLSKASNISHVSEKSVAVEVTFEDESILVGDYYLRFNANSGQNRFRFYSGTSVSPVVLYKMDDSGDAKGYISEAETYASMFLSTVTCSGKDTAGSITNPTLDWSSDSGESLAEKYLALSVDAQGYLASLVGDQTDGSTGPAGAVGRYDYVIKKYGETTYSDFMNRVESGKLVLGANINSWFATSNNSTFLIIVIISSIALATIVGCVVLHRRKEQQ